MDGDLRRATLKACLTLNLTLTLPLTLTLSCRGRQEVILDTISRHL